MKNDILAVNAHLIARPGCEEKLKARLEQLVRDCRDHQGLLVYRLHQDTENPALFVFYEQFASREAFEDHLNSDELRIFQKEIPGLLDGEGKIYTLKILADHNEPA